MREPVAPVGSGAAPDLVELAGIVARQRAELDRLRSEGERMIKLAEGGGFPFDGTYCDARPDPEWSLPSLPEELLVA